MTRPAAVPGSAAARRTGATDRWINYAAATTVAGLAGVAGALSYSHMRQLAQEHGQVGWHAHAFPLSVDGVEIVASLVLLANRRAGHRSGWLPWAALAAGTAGSLAANIATAHPDLVSRVIVGWPALALLLAIKLLAGILEHRDAPGSRAAIVPAPALPASIPDQADPASAALARKVPECTGGPATSQAGPGASGTAGTARPPDITELPPAASDLMVELIPESPSWYNVGSSVAHSHYWGLRDVNRSPPGQQMNLVPDVMNVGAAAESAISASGVILENCARMFGHDPAKDFKRTRARRERVDALMRRATTSAWAHIPTES